MKPGGENNPRHQFGGFHALAGIIPTNRIPIKRIGTEKTVGRALSPEQNGTQHSNRTRWNASLHEGGSRTALTIGHPDKLGPCSYRPRPATAIKLRAALHPPRFARRLPPHKKTQAGTLVQHLDSGLRRNDNKRAGSRAATGGDPPGSARGGSRAFSSGSRGFAESGANFRARAFSNRGGEPIMSRRHLKH